MPGLTTVIDRALEWGVVTSFTRLGYAVRARVPGWRPLESYRLDGRVALVTGAGSGIGLACASILVKRGYYVVGLDVRRGPLDIEWLDRKSTRLNSSHT